MSSDITFDPAISPLLVVSELTDNNYIFCNRKQSDKAKKWLRQKGKKHGFVKHPCGTYKKKINYVYTSDGREIEKQILCELVVIGDIKVSFGKMNKFSWYSPDPTSSIEIFKLESSTPEILRIFNNISDYPISCMADIYNWIIHSRTSNKLIWINKWSSRQWAFREWLTHYAKRHTSLHAELLTAVSCKY